MFFKAGLLKLQILCQYARVHDYITEHLREVVSISFSQKNILASNTTKWKIPCCQKKKKKKKSIYCNHRQSCRSTILGNIDSFQGC